ncbi:cytochrome c oxidase assembly protein [Arsenicicoccus dermatophilus]|uniref:cytochrome c oxidase assembly protein n=1 Tax=Arsenicicoccus dermatophilus TaxID=1076331 RepID=UPI001F4CC002|nr:cytochrome c oxidase assembly protein [Arsenicicoccus dermatophilus]
MTGLAHPAPALRRSVPTIPLLAALVAVVLGGLAGGAFAVDRLADPGALVRWGLPLVRALHDVAFAATVGLLLVGTMLVPDDAEGSRRVAAARAAGATGMVWAVTGLLGVVLTFAGAAGMSPLDPGFGDQFGAVAMTFDALKAMVFASLLAIAVTTGAAVGRSRFTLAWMLVLGLVACFPLGLAGHAAGGTAHDTAVTSLQYHLVGAVLWLGGLIGILVLRPRLDAPALATTVERYSTVATWSLAFVALSGVLNATLRVGSLGALGSAYGLVLLVKVALLVALALIGLQQRRAYVARLREHPEVGRGFARFAAIETAVMGLAVGLGVALSRSAPPVPQSRPGISPVESLTGYPAPPEPHAWSWLTTWRVDWLWLSLSLVAVGLYLHGVRILRRRGDRWPVLRTVAWLVGHLIFLHTTQGAPGVYGKVSFSWHMSMHMALSMAVPMFLVMAAPSTLALRVLQPRRDGSFGLRELLLASLHSRWLGFMANPIVAAVNFFFSLIVFYYSPLFELALRTHTGHVLMVVHFILAGYGFAWVLIGIDPGPRKWTPPMRLVLLLGTIGFHTWFGISLMTGTGVLAREFYETLHLGWGWKLLQDQQDGGGIAWGVGEFPTMLLSLLVVLDWVRSDSRETRRYDREADRDDDAQLRAYNERLARMAAHDKDLEARR